MFLIASVAYGMSIFIDIFTYHLKLNIHDNSNVRYLFSLINIFQYSARAFVLIFVPIMAYYTENVRDKNSVWEITFLSHLFVILFLLPLYSKKLSYFLSKKIIQILNLFFGKSKKINYSKIENVDQDKIENKVKTNTFLFIFFSYFSGLLFSFSITFLYFLSFSYPEKALTLASFSQIINMFGSLLLILLIDPKIMSSIDNGFGEKEIRLLTSSRILVHVSLIILLLIIK